MTIRAWEVEDTGHTSHLREFSGTNYSDLMEAITEFVESLESLGGMSLVAITFGVEYPRTIGSLAYTLLER